MGPLSISLVQYERLGSQGGIAWLAKPSETTLSRNRTEHGGLDLLASIIGVFSVDTMRPGTRRFK